MKHLAKIQTEFVKQSALFTSQESLDAYLKKHPEANRSNHRVIKPITTGSRNKMKFINYAELKKNFELVKKKLNDDVYLKPGDEKHMHFVNYKAFQDAQKMLKDKKADWAVEKSITN